MMILRLQSSNTNTYEMCERDFYFATQKTRMQMLDKLASTHRLMIACAPLNSTNKIRSIFIDGFFHVLVLATGFAFVQVRQKKTLLC